MSNVQKDFLSLINDAVVDTIYSLGQKVLFEAKSTVPVKTGNLKATGTISKISGGCRITFGGSAAPYAGIIEEGREAEFFDNTPNISTVKRHTRRTPTGTVSVKNHTRTTIGKRPVLLENGNWVTVNKIPAVKGTFFLEKALEKTLMNELGKQIRASFPKTMSLKV